MKIWISYSVLPRICGFGLSLKSIFFCKCFNKVGLSRTQFIENTFERPNSGWAVGVGGRRPLWKLEYFYEKIRGWFCFRIFLGYDPLFFSKNIYGSFFKNNN